MLLVNTDDLQCISEDPKSILSKLDQHYLLKKDSIVVPKTYLRGKIGDYRLPDDPEKTRWSMS
jgi:azurin